MLFSIITPSYNQAPFLDQTMRSVIGQKVDYDYQVIDGGSTDGSVEIIQKFKNQLSRWVSEPDNGQSHAINKGLKEAKGDIINWLNSDDYYEPDALGIVLEKMSNETTGLGGRSRLFNNDRTLSYSRGTDIYPDNVAKTIGWARIDQPETFFSKQAWDAVGLLNEQLHYCMDREWWMRYLYHFGLTSFKMTDDILVNFRIHQDSKTQTSQPGFLKEHHSLYLAMAKVAEHKEAIRFLTNELDIDSNLQTEILNWDTSQLVRSSFQYYLLKSADEFYANRQFELSRGFLKLIDPDLIESQDRQLYKKLKRRSRFGAVIKILKP